jgi:hypothetical protein
MHRLQTLVGVLVFSSAALAQTGVEANTNASASQNASVSAGRSGAQAQSNTAVNADASAQASNEQKTEKARNRSRTDSTSASSGAQFASGTTINAVLVKPVDARKNKPGDAVIAKTTQDVKSDGQVVIPKGSRVIGHVTQANARAKGEGQSRLGMVFDHAVLKNGQEVPLNTTVQAVAAAQNATYASAGDDIGSMSSMGSGAVSSGARTGGGLLGGVGSTAGATTGTVTNVTAGVGGSASGALNSAASASGSVAGSLNSTSTGVVSLPGMALNSATSAATQGSVITSAGKNIHLDSGTQMLLKVTGSSTRQ